MKKFFYVISCMVIFVFCGACLFACQQEPTNGKSAYEIAVDNGFEGSQQDWLNSLIGKNGQNGKDGQNGQDLTIDAIFEKAVGYGLYENNAEGYKQFLKDYFSNSSANNSKVVEEVANKCLNQVVSIYCENNSGNISAGAGVFYKINTTENYAYIITNYHVITCQDEVSTVFGSTYNYYQATTIKVYLYGSETLSLNANGTLKTYGSNAMDATVVGGSANYDLAVLKISGESFNIIKQSSSKAVTFANSDNVSLGSLAVAVGNPMGAGIAVNSGVISCDSEYVNLLIGGSGRAVRCLRIDTPINGGNSGGGLFDKNGNLLGIVNAKKADYLNTKDNSIISYENVGYAIAGNNVKNVVENIIDFYEINYNSEKDDNTVGVYKFLIGVELGIENPRNVYSEKYNTNTLYEDVVVSKVNDNSIAKTIGMVSGDKIVKVNVENTTNGNREYTITRRFQLLDNMLTLRENEIVTYTVLRIDANTGLETEVELTPFTVDMQNFAIYKGLNVEAE